METSPQSTIKRKVLALSIVEVLIALAIVSLVFVSVLNTTFAALRQVKKLELQDRMLTLANEGVEIIKKEKDESWNGLIGPSGVFRSVNGRAYVTYTQQGSNKIASLTTMTQTCGLRSDQTFDSSCSVTAVSQTGSDALFGRLIELRQLASGTGSFAQFTVTVACINGQCLPADYKPVVLTIYVYRTGTN
ncbi:MAG: hypothetical protein QY314_04030 [Candidatus Dojkabacteria bacterium]|nr:MAG: hypothetical protein QY314_04030 [Candidatus Dojkabacteria bacterium]